MSIEEKITIEKNRLDKIIEESNGNLLYEMIQIQSRKIDRLIVKYLKYGNNLKVIANN